MLTGRRDRQLVVNDRTSQLLVEQSADLCEHRPKMLQYFGCGVR